MCSFKQLAITLLLAFPLFATTPSKVERELGTEDNGPGPLHQSYSTTIATADFLITMVETGTPTGIGTVTVTDNCGGGSGNTWVEYTPARLTWTGAGDIGLGGDLFFYVAHPIAASGGCQVTVNCDSTATWCTMSNHHWTGINQASPFDGASTFYSGSTTATTYYGSALTLNYAAEALFAMGPQNGNITGMASNSSAWTFCNPLSGTRGLGGDICGYAVTTTGGSFGTISHAPQFVSSCASDWDMSIVGLVGAGQSPLGGGMPTLSLLGTGR